MEKICIRWLGHSCFRVECKGYSLVIDPFGPREVPGFADICEKAHEVLCTHGHGDHNYAKAVTLIHDGTPSPFTVTALDSWHDDKQGELRGKNTIYLLEAEGMRVVHFGDVGCMPEPQVLQAIHGADAVMIPVGGFYTVNADEAKSLVEQVSPRVVIPMHYRSAQFGLEVIGPLEDYLSLCDDVVHYDTDSMELTHETPPQTAVLKVSL